MTAFRKFRHAMNAGGIAGVLMLTAPAFAAPATPGSVPPEVLAPHRAIYELTLVEARDRAGIRSITGRLVYEFERRGCHFALNYRQVMSLTSGEGQGGLLDYRSNTDEDDTGKSFSFQSRSEVSGQAPTEIGGLAERGDGNSVTVTLQQPEAKTASIPIETLFPTQHLRRVLAAAQAGEFLLVADIFDGGEPADTASSSVTFIGRVQQPAEQGPDDLPAASGLDRLPRWPVTISYFDRADPKGDNTPKFIFSAEIYENGISRALRLDYGNFVVSGRLVKLERLPPGECPSR